MPTNAKLHGRWIFGGPDETGVRAFKTFDHRRRQHIFAGMLADPLKERFPIGLVVVQALITDSSKLPAIDPLPRITQDNW
jgi:hypothetical protein